MLSSILILKSVHTLKRKSIVKYSIMIVLLYSSVLYSADFSTLPVLSVKDLFTNEPCERTAQEALNILETIIQQFEEDNSLISRDDTINISETSNTFLSDVDERDFQNSYISPQTISLLPLPFSQFLEKNQYLANTLNIKPPPIQTESFDNSQTIQLKNFFEKRRERPPKHDTLHKKTFLCTVKECRKLFTSCLG